MYNLFAESLTLALLAEMPPEQARDVLMRAINKLCDRGSREHSAEIIHLHPRATEAPVDG